MLLLEKKIKSFDEKLIRIEKKWGDNVIEVQRKPQSLINRGIEMAFTHQNQEQIKGLVRGI